MSASSPKESDDACFMVATNISTEARANRLILADALAGVGLVNYPTEWWHWSFGDRYKVGCYTVVIAETAIRSSA